MPLQPQPLLRAKFQLLSRRPACGTSVRPRRCPQGKGSPAMRTSMAYFAGAGTVVVAIAAGLGGGLLLANIVSPHSPKAEMTKVERRMSPEPIPAANAPAEPVPYLATTQPPSAGPAVAAAPMQAEPTQPQTEAANRAPAAAQPAEQTAANEPTAKLQDTPRRQDTPKQSSAPAEQPATREPAATPEEAFTKAREADAKRATERRKAERRQQWVDRRRLPQREDQELQDVERKVREETEPRDFSEQPVRAFTERPVRSEMP